MLKTKLQKSFFTLVTYSVARKMTALMVEIYRENFNEIVICFNWLNLKSSKNGA